MELKKPSNDMQALSDFLLEVEFEDENWSSDDDSNDGIGSQEDRKDGDMNEAKAGRGNYLIRLHAMLEECPKSVASWTNDGLAFQVHDPKELEDVILRRYFKSIRFESFCRQLNSYQFVKRRIDSLKLEFRHPNFVRGQIQLLRTIRRRKRQKSRRVHEATTNTPPQDLREALAEMMTSVNTFKTELDEAKHSIRSLMDQNL